MRLDTITTARCAALVAVLAKYVTYAQLKAHLQATGWRVTPHQKYQGWQVWTAPLPAAGEEEPFEMPLTGVEPLLMADLRYVENMLPLIAALENSSPLAVVLDLVPPAIREWALSGLAILEVGDERA